MPSRRILVVEDDAAIRGGIVDALRFKGFVVVEAGNGVDGLRLAESADVDLILLDLVLPGPGGLEILRSVRESRPTLPVIVLTAKGEEDDRVLGCRAAPTITW
jgi:DNA-binding response OmpR family regulator